MGLSVMAVCCRFVMGWVGGLAGKSSGSLWLRLRGSARVMVLRCRGSYKDFFYFFLCFQMFICNTNFLFFSFFLDIK